jgi:hypothetical protein
MFLQEILVICGIVVSWGVVVQAVITGLNCCNCMLDSVE